jgi:hypothetical protein
VNPLFQRIAVGLPILLIVVMIGRAEWQLNHSETWHFAIQGSDPRDLLRGHYMRFRLVVTPDEVIDACTVGAPDCCYCLEPGDGLEAHVALASCETASNQCEAFVRTGPLHDFDRFYIPEEGRRDMEKQLREAALEDRAHLAVAVSVEGEPLIEALLIDGEPIKAAVADGDDPEH